MHNNPRLEALWENEFDIVPFRELPLTHKLAIAWYMAIDGEAWCDVVEEHPRGFKALKSSKAANTYYTALLTEMMPLFDKRYGDIEFGFGLWNTMDIIRSIAHDEHMLQDSPEEVTIQSFTSPEPGRLEGYHVREYPEKGRWPVIMSSHKEETLQDGWKRFSFYAGSGYEQTPVVFYPHQKHYELLEERKGRGIRP